MPENHMTYQEKLTSLRAEIAAQSLDGFILPRTDEYQGEFLAPYAERLAWLTGFTGSAGLTVILKDKAVVMSDGRYTIQLRQQVDVTLYETANSVEVSAGDWIESYVPAGARIGYDPWLYTPKQLEVLQKKLSNAVLVSVKRNPVDVIWRDRPLRPTEPVCLFSDKIAGRSSAEKRHAVAETLKSQDAQLCVLTAADSICWLLNVRGNDVEFTPLVQSYAFLWADGTLDWFVESEKVPETVKHHLGDGVRLHNPQNLGRFILTLKEKRILFDRNSAPSWFEVQIGSCGAKVLDHKDPCIEPKAIKTAEEQDSIRDVHRRDALAMIRFMIWLEVEAPKGKLTEIGVADKLESFRKMDPHYRGQSFATIAGFAGNGAIIHYRAAAETNKQIKGNGLLLLDSGGQYDSGGTTDITRTFAVGQPLREMQENYTRVLKGHIALARSSFPAGTTGAQIDTLARQPLWEVGLDYPHGTGHGVGCYLGVHEEAANISPRGQVALTPGMLISNEPGYYKENSYGIRIENLILVVEKGFCKETNKIMLGFETITLVPYAHELIVPELLDDADRKWLAEYYMNLTDALEALLSPAEKRWLEKEVKLLC